MSDTMIKVEDLGKKYIISHQGSASYTAMRDVIANKTKKLLSKKTETPTKEEFWALKNLSFEIKKGDAIGIIGRNGAGKSTLLKVLSRITEPTHGKIEINGRVASLLEVGTGFHPELTGRENIFLNGAILGMSRSEIRSKFDEIVDFSGVEKFLDTPVKRYSSGMYVRLAFAVAAHLEPEILIVDEVLAVGDAEFQKKCLGKMEDVSKGEGRTVLFVSHNMAAISSLCNNAILLAQGQLIKYGDCRSVMEEYVNNSITGDSIWQRKTPLNPIASFLTAAIVDEKGNRTNTVSNSKPFFFYLELEVNQAGFDGTFALEVQGISGDSIFCTHDFDLGTSFSKKEKYKVQIAIPTILRTGNYIVTLGANTRGFTTLEYFQKVMTFEYIDEINQGQIANRPGAVFMPLEWNVL